jgi:hypothetical protein
LRMDSLARLSGNRAKGARELFAATTYRPLIWFNRPGCLSWRLHALIVTLGCIISVRLCTIRVEKKQRELGSAPSWLRATWRKARAFLRSRSSNDLTFPTTLTAESFGRGHPIKGICCYRRRIKKLRYRTEHICEMTTNSYDDPKSEHKIILKNPRSGLA